MLKRFVALVMALVMILGVGLVAYAVVPYPGCGHDDFIFKFNYEYRILNKTTHAVYRDITITCTTCGKVTEGQEVDEELHNTKGSYDYHVEGRNEHGFVQKCSKCGCHIQVVTKTCSGSPHVSSPW